MENLKNVIITEITDLFNIYSPKGRYEKMVDRPCYGLSFCNEGQITYEHNGKSYISDNKHAIILPMNQSYTIKGNKTGIFAVINFKCLNHLSDEFILLPTDKTKVLLNEFELMKKLSLFSENHTKVMSIFYNIINIIISENSLCKTISPAINYIEENYKEADISNKKLADICNISEVYLRKLFKKHLSITPKQYISNIRLQKAKQLLSEGVLKVNAVAEECGFDSSYNFCRFFKEKTGTTPTDYLKQNAVYKI